MKNSTWLQTLLLLGTLATAHTQESASQDPEALFRKGVAAFFAGDPKQSVQAFDALIALKPEVKPQLWQRGLSLYLADQFQAGREQFEVHQTVNTSDVENAAWHFLCVARLKGLENARAALIPISGDTRVPMKQVHALFAGKGNAEAVLEAAKNGAESEIRNQLCYAHLYLGLYYEAVQKSDLARKHMVLAAIDYSMDHYMGKCAQVHARLRGWLPKSEHKAE